MADEPNGHDEEQEQQIVEIRIEPQNQVGVWSNFARVNHSPHEFTIDFIRLDFASEPLTGIVAARVAVSPLFITQLIAALQDNWDKYAKKAMPKEVYGDNDSE
jgi:hypothetical protein